MQLVAAGEVGLACSRSIFGQTMLPMRDRMMELCQIDDARLSLKEENSICFAMLRPH
jgi:hypothetical protein